MGSCRPLALALALLTGAAGCQHLSEQPPPKATPIKASIPDKPAELRPDKDIKPTKPKAGTYVAFADFRAKSSFGTEYTPEQQRQLREQARVSYLKAIEEDDKYLPAYLGLARLAGKSENYAASITMYQKALALSGTDATIWYELGLIQCRQKDWQSALVSLRKAVDLNPGNRPYLNALGLAHARAGQLLEAKMILTRLHGESKANYDLARMLRHMNRVEEARMFARTAIASDPANQPARDLLAELDGRKQAAIQQAGYTPQPGHTPQAAPPPAAAQIQPAR